MWNVLSSDFMCRDFESRFVPTKISGGDISGEEVMSCNKCFCESRPNNLVF